MNVAMLLLVSRSNPRTAKLLNEEHVCVQQITLELSARPPPPQPFPTPSPPPIACQLAATTQGRRGRTRHHNLLVSYRQTRSSERKTSCLELGRALYLRMSRGKRMPGNLWNISRNKWEGVKLNLP